MCFELSRVASRKKLSETFGASASSMVLLTFKAVGRWVAKLLHFYTEIIYCIYCYNAVQDMTDSASWAIGVQSQYRSIHHKCFTYFFCQKRIDAAMTNTRPLFSQ
jgi:hypothetical protein